MASSSGPGVRVASRRYRTASVSWREATAMSCILRLNFFSERWKPGVSVKMSCPRESV